LCNYAITLTDIYFTMESHKKTTAEIKPRNKTKITKRSIVMSGPSDCLKAKISLRLTNGT